MSDIYYTIADSQLYSAQQTSKNYSNFFKIIHEFHKINLIAAQDFAKCYCYNLWAKLTIWHSKMPIDYLCQALSDSLLYKRQIKCFQLFFLLFLMAYI